MKPFLASTRAVAQHEVLAGMVTRQKTAANYMDVM
jgi:hypothetical protein